MDYGRFSSALSHIRRGPSPLEVAAWLGAGALGGVADTMERRRQEARDDARYAREMALREAYQEVQTDAMLANQTRENEQFKQEYGVDPATGKPVYDYSPTAPAPSTSLPGPTQGGAWLAPPKPGPLEQPRFTTDVQPLPPQIGKKPVQGFAARRIALQEQAQRSAIATAELERQIAQVKLDDSKDPKTKAVLLQNLEAQRDAHKAAAAAGYANAAESRARADALSTDTQNAKLAGPWAKVQAAYIKAFTPSAVDLMANPGIADAETGLRAGAPSMAQWVKSWPPAMRRAYGIKDEDLAAPSAPPTPSPMPSHGAGAGGGGNAAKPLDGATAASIFQEAGGDPEKARQIARERGYTF